MNARSCTGHARWWLRLALASGLTVGVLVLQEPAGRGRARRSKHGSRGRHHAVVPRSLVPDEFTHVRIGPTGQGRRVQPPADRPVGRRGLQRHRFVDRQLNRQRTQVTGVWELQLFYTFADGTTDQCDSGPGAVRRHPLSRAAHERAPSRWPGLEMESGPSS